MEIIADLAQYLCWGIWGFLFFMQAIEQRELKKRRVICGVVFVAAYVTALYFSGYVASGFGLLPFLLLAAPILSNMFRLKPALGITRLLIANSHVAAIQIIFLAVIPLTPWAPAYMTQILRILATCLLCVFLFLLKLLYRYKFVQAPSRKAYLYPTVILFLFSNLIALPETGKWWLRLALMPVACVLCLLAGRLLSHILSRLSYMRSVQKALEHPVKCRNDNWEFSSGILELLEEARDKHWSAGKTIKMIEQETKMLNKAISVKEANLHTGLSHLETRLILTKEYLKKRNVDFEVKTFRKIEPQYFGDLKAHHVCDLITGAINHAWAAIQLDGNSPHRRFIKVTLGLVQRKNEQWYEINVFDNGKRRDWQSYAYGRAQELVEELLKILRFVNGSLLIGSHSTREGMNTTRVTIRLDGKRRFCIHGSYQQEFGYDRITSF